MSRSCLNSSTVGIAGTVGKRDTLLATAETMAALDAAGLRAHVYTVNDPDEAELSPSRASTAAPCYADEAPRFY